MSKETLHSGHLYEVSPAPAMQSLKLQLHSFDCSTT